MKTKPYIKIIKCVITTILCVSTIWLTKSLIDNTKHIYKTEERQQALTRLLDILQ